MVRRTPVHPVQASLRAHDGARLQVSPQLQGGRPAPVASVAVEESVAGSVGRPAARWSGPAALRHVLDDPGGGSRSLARRRKHLQHDVGTTIACRGGTAEGRSRLLHCRSSCPGSAPMCLPVLGASTGLGSRLVHRKGAPTPAVVPGRRHSRGICDRHDSMGVRFRGRLIVLIPESPAALEPVPARPFHVLLAAPTASAVGCRVTAAAVVVAGRRRALTAQASAMNPSKGAPGPEDGMPAGQVPPRRSDRRPRSPRPGRHPGHGCTRRRRHPHR